MLSHHPPKWQKHFIAACNNLISVGSSDTLRVNILCKLPCLGERGSSRLQGRAVCLQTRASFPMAVASQSREHPKSPLPWGCSGCSKFLDGCKPFPCLFFRPQWDLVPQGCWAGCCRAARIALPGPRLWSFHWVLISQQDKEWQSQEGRGNARDSFRRRSKTCNYGDQLLIGINTFETNSVLCLDIFNFVQDMRNYFGCIFLSCKELNYLAFVLHLSPLWQSGERINVPDWGLFAAKAVARTASVLINYVYKLDFVLLSPDGELL